MSASTHLERRYRRLLAFYPAAFRREHEEEILSVLMDGAAEGQQRPGLAESVNLLTQRSRCGGHLPRDPACNA